MSEEADRADVVIVGAGQGGAHVAMFLRQQKFAGSIALVGDEPVLPYERPAMSKEYLAGEKTLDKLVLRPETFWKEKNVDVRLGARVTAVDPNARTVVVANAERPLAYGKLVWATGGAPRRLPSAPKDLAGVHYVRCQADIDRMQAELEKAETIAIIGGGYIGLEVAACLRTKGKRVTILEAQERVLARVAGEALARFFEKEHLARGVDVRLGAIVTGLETRDGRVSGVKLGDTEVLAADLVVVGIGIDAAVEPLLQAGAEGKSGGVLVDLHGKTSLPDIYAVGDCATHPNIHATNGQAIRLESIQNANDQAMIAAKSIAGTLKETERYESVPWFWSNQYDLRLQTVGLFNDHDEVIVRGDPAARSFSVVYLRKGRVVALDCVNLTKDYVQGKALIVSGREVDREKLARADVTLKELV